MGKVINELIEKDKECTTTRRFAIQLKRVRHNFAVTDERAKNYLLFEGEPCLETQDQYKDKWYRKFMNNIRIKIGDGETLYKDLKYINGPIKDEVIYTAIVGLVTAVIILSVLIIFI